MEKSKKQPEQIESFGGWESDREKLLRNLTWTKEEILNWLEEANAFSREITDKNSFYENIKKTINPDHSTLHTRWARR